MTQSVDSDGIALQLFATDSTVNNIVVRTVGIAISINLVLNNRCTLGVTQSVDSDGLTAHFFTAAGALNNTIVRTGSGTGCRNYILLNCFTLGVGMQCGGVVGNTITELGLNVENRRRLSGCSCICSKNCRVIVIVVIAQMSSSCTILAGCNNSSLIGVNSNRPRSVAIYIGLQLQIVVLGAACCVQIAIAIRIIKRIGAIVVCNQFQYLNGIVDRYNTLINRNNNCCTVIVSLLGAQCIVCFALLVVSNNHNLLAVSQLRSAGHFLIYLLAVAFFFEAINSVQAGVVYGLILFVNQSRSGHCLRNSILCPANEDVFNTIVHNGIQVRQDCSSTLNHYLILRCFHIRGNIEGNGVLTSGEVVGLRFVYPTLSPLIQLNSLLVLVGTRLVVTEAITLSGVETQICTARADNIHSIFLSSGESNGINQRSSTRGQFIFIFAMSDILAASCLNRVAASHRSNRKCVLCKGGICNNAVYNIDLYTVAFSIQCG